MLGVGIPLATIDTPEMEYVPQEKRTKIEQKQFPGTDNLKKKTNEAAFGINSIATDP